MNPKISKLRREQQKVRDKIAALQTKDKELDKEIRDLENMDIVGLVRAEGLTLEGFTELMQQLRENPIPQKKGQQEVEAHEQAS